MGSGIVVWNLQKQIDNSHESLLRTSLIELRHTVSYFWVKIDTLPADSP